MPGKSPQEMKRIRSRAGSGEYKRIRRLASELVRECGYFTSIELAAVAKTSQSSANEALRTWRRKGVVCVVGATKNRCHMYTFSSFLPEPFEPLTDAELADVHDALDANYPPGVSDRLHERIRCANLYWSKIMHTTLVRQGLRTD